MPTATTTKSAMAGVKRKSAPVRNAHVNETKKAKIDPGMKSALKTKSKPLPVNEDEELSDEGSEDSDSDGGVPLNFESDEPEELKEVEEVGEGEEDESDSEQTPTNADGLHPERAKAVLTNSEISY
jgi:pumilio family protein 6